MNGSIGWAASPRSATRPRVHVSSDGRSNSAHLTFARDLLHGIWKGDERTTSSIYATDRAMLWAWTDPVIADACRTTDVDLAWLISGSNTLYLSTPPTDHERVAPVLSPTTTL